MQGMTVRFELFTDEPKQAVNFYTAILGFKIKYSNERYYSLKRDSVTIGIGSSHKLKGGHHFRPEIIAERKGLGVEIVLEVNDIQMEYEQIIKKGYPINEELIKREWGLTDFRIIDPDGYYLRFTSRK